MNITEDQVEIVARHLQGLGWSSGGDYDDDFKPDVRAALNHLAATHPHSPDAADSGRVTPEMVDWLITYQSRLIVNGLHPEDARLWMKSHELKDFDYAASAVDEADAAWNDHFADPDDDGPADFKLSQAFVDRVTRDESGEPPVMDAALAAQPGE